MTLPQQGGPALAPVVSGSDDAGYSIRVQMIRTAQLTSVAANQVPEGAKSLLRLHLADQATNPRPIGVPWWATDPKGDWFEVSGGGWAVFARAKA